MEVLANALEASPCGGTITVSTNDTPMCQVEVVDQGDPIPDDIRDRLKHGERVDQNEGRGWGLSLAQRAARNIACRLTCCASAEAGNTTTLTIPSIVS
jgi:signal transduction histidine kinase